MFLPIGDAPNPEGFRPYVNWALLAVNVAVFVLISLPLMGEPAAVGSLTAQDYARALGQRPGTQYDLFIFEYGLKPGAFALGDLFASMFLHGGIMHLAGNMLFLWIYGDNVEHYLGRVRYLLAYLATGIVATLTFSAFAGGSMIPMVGASGAISGVLGFYFLLFPRNRVKVFVFLFPFILNVFLIPARIVLGLYLVLDNLFPVLIGASSGVAYGAHIGGFVGGLGLAWLLERRGGVANRAIPRSGWRAPDRPRAPSVVDTTARDAYEALRDALEGRDLALAADLAAQLGPKELRRLPLAEQLLTAQALNRAGRPALAAHLLRGALAEQQTNPRAQAEIYLALGLIRLDNGQPTAAYQHLLTVLELAPGTSAANRAADALSSIAPQTYRPN